MRKVHLMRGVATAILWLAVVAAASGCVARRVIAAPPGAKPMEEPPPGMVEVDFISEYYGQSWRVFAGGNLVCTTPCTQWVNPSEPLVLISNDRERLEVFDLGAEAVETRHALVAAQGTCDGKYVTGLALTTFGGMGAVVAIALTAIGCSDVQERGGICTAGLITGVTLPITAGAIWMMIDGLPQAHILPVYRSQAAKGQSPVSVAFLPNGIYGKF